MTDQRTGPGFAGANPGRRLIIAASLLFLAAGCGYALASPAIDSKAPGLVVTALGRPAFDLGKLRGKVVLVNYWATWCAPCKKEMPVLNQFFQRHHAEGLEMIGISADRPQDFDKMRRMSNRCHTRLQLLTRFLTMVLDRLKDFPLTYVIDRNGVIRDKFIDVREQLLRDVVLPLLSR